MAQLSDLYPALVNRSLSEDGGLSNYALSYVRFANEVEGLEDTRLFYRFPELFECIDANDPGSNFGAASLTGMLKRHASAVIRVMEEQIALASGELARETLPPDCLIRLIAGSGEAQGKTEFFRHNADYREVWLGNQRFDLTVNQARVVELLDQQRLNGTTSLSQGYILAELDIGSQNLYQVFRGTTAWNRLVIRAEGRGMYKLNIPSE